MSARQIKPVNKKIKNATTKEYNGIKFRSQLEVMTYKTLLSEGFSPKYEEDSFCIFPSQAVSVPLFTKNKFKNKNKGIQPISLSACIDRRSLSKLTYTPDFTFDYNGKHIIIEVKGFATDTFVYRFKLFRAYLESLPDKDSIELWEIFTKAQLLDCIRHLKAEINN